MGDAMLAEHHVLRDLAVGQDHDEHVDIRTDLVDGRGYCFGCRCGCVGFNTMPCCEVLHAHGTRVIADEWISLGQNAAGHWCAHGTEPDESNSWEGVL